MRCGMSSRVMAAAALAAVLPLFACNAYASEVSLDRRSYPVPPPLGDLRIFVSIHDADFDVSHSGTDRIAQDVSGKPGVGPVKVSVKRGDAVVLGYAGGPKALSGKIDSAPLAGTAAEEAETRQFGPIIETAPGSGVFGFTLVLESTDGPRSSGCPRDIQYSGLGGDPDGGAGARFDDAKDRDAHCIMQGDVLIVEYLDPADHSGHPRKATASASFGLSGAALQGRTDSFRIGHPFVLVVEDPDLNLDSKKAESYPLDLLVFRYENYRTSLGSDAAIDAFEPRPRVLRETGENTGVFYTELKIPRVLDGMTIHIGKKISFEYRDGGTAASGFVGNTVEKVKLGGTTGGAVPARITGDSAGDGNPNNAEEDPSIKQGGVDSGSRGNECRDTMISVIKRSTGEPACVMPRSLDALIERGWAVLPE